MCEHRQQSLSGPQAVLTQRFMDFTTPKGWPGMMLTRIFPHALLSVYSRYEVSVGQVNFYAVSATDAVAVVLNLSRVGEKCGVMKFDSLAANKASARLALVVFALFDD